MISNLEVDLKNNRFSNAILQNTDNIPISNKNPIFSTFKHDNTFQVGNAFNNYHGPLKYYHGVNLINETDKNNLPIDSQIDLIASKSKIVF